ncbi:MBL fold metallo-hydrolase RNA specificity domain-containing protein [Polynucleobacter difficilis]|uniref:MBL fold metallo-hydrolase RNA specificity domain-containing protein n=1 Tax=Polynucleobacter difficilis TaxID=556054 RepID=UPI000D39699A|nr:MBL fold metallo-hydrolase [Polynucleobacter difficilis]
MKIQFLGAAGEVTGSKYLLEMDLAQRSRRVIVDYGMFQGGREALEKNQGALRISASEVDCVILTHAHIDHSGLLPRLCASGFKGPIYCTGATFELLKIMLPDSAHLQLADSERAAKKIKQGKWRGTVPEPLYSAKEVEIALSQIRVVEYHQTIELFAGLRLSFYNAGHILGSAIAVLDVQETGAKSKRCVFSGDLGMQRRPLMPDPELIESADIVVVESTYGDRLHRTMADTEDELVGVICKVMAEHGNIVMPAFAVGRTQEVLFVLIDLVRRGRLPNLHVWVDSPMATAATRLTEHFFAQLDPESQSTFAWLKENPAALHLRFIADVEESKALNRVKGGAIIISASGMCDAGRVLHHLLWNLPRAQNAVVITGFQAQGSLGRRLVDGAASIRVMHQEVPVRASIHTIGGLSAHADQSGLLKWLKGFKKAPQKVFVTHGEEKSSSALAAAIQRELHWADVTVPVLNQIEDCSL